MGSVSEHLGSSSVAHLTFKLASRVRKGFPLANGKFACEPPTLRCSIQNSIRARNTDSTQTASLPLCSAAGRCSRSGFHQLDSLALSLTDRCFQSNELVSHAPAFPLSQRELFSRFCLSAMAGASDWRSPMVTSHTPAGPNVLAVSVRHRDIRWDTATGLSAQRIQMDMHGRPLRC